MRFATFAAGLASRRRYEREQGADALAEQDEIRARIEIGFGGIRSIRARCDDAAAGALRRADHLACRASHPFEAHLAQIVEIVFVEQHQLRLAAAQLLLEFRSAFRQHRIEESHAMAGLAQQRRHLQRGQRRVRLGALELLAVEPQEVRMAYENGQHLR